MSDFSFDFSSGLDFDFGGGSSFETGLTNDSGTVTTFGFDLDEFRSPGQEGFSTTIPTIDGLNAPRTSTNFFPNAFSDEFISSGQQLPGNTADTPLARAYIDAVNQGLSQQDRSTQSLNDAFDDALEEAQRERRDGVPNIIQPNTGGSGGGGGGFSPFFGFPLYDPEVDRQQQRIESDFDIRFLNAQNTAALQQIRQGGRNDRSLQRVADAGELERLNAQIAANYGLFDRETQRSYDLFGLETSRALDLANLDANTRLEIARLDREADRRLSDREFLRDVGLGYINSIRRF